jgi:hypothetical protein
MTSPTGREDDFYIIPKELWAPEASSPSSPCSDPLVMLKQFADTLSDRKLRLFAIACCRRVLSLVSDENARAALEVAERFADDQATSEELTRAHDAAQRVLNGFPPLDAEFDALPVPDQDAIEAGRIACWAIVYSTEEQASEAAEMAAVGAASARAWEYRLSCGPSVLGAARDRAADMGSEWEQQCQIEMLRDMFHRPSDLSNQRRDAIPGAVRTFAEMIYEQQSFMRMKELAAVIEQAGECPQPIVDHCIAPGPHVRGCWALDWILGRE